MSLYEKYGFDEYVNAQLRCAYLETMYVVDRTIKEIPEYRPPLHLLTNYDFENVESLIRFGVNYEDIYYHPVYNSNLTKIKVRGLNKEFLVKKHVSFFLHYIFPQLDGYEKTKPKQDPLAKVKELVNQMSELLKEIQTSK